MHEWRLAVFGRWHVNGLELVHGDHAREFKCVVLVRFSSDVGPSPSFLVGGTDEGFQAKRHREVIDPARRATGLHGDEVNLFAFEDRIEVSGIGRGGEKPGLTGSGIKEAAHGVEFAELKCENLHVSIRPRVWLVEKCD